MILLLDLIIINTNIYIWLMSPTMLTVLWLYFFEISSTTYQREITKYLYSCIIECE